MALFNATGSVLLTDFLLFSSHLPVQLCMEALRQILPKDTVLQVLIRWYDTHNAPGSVNGQSEWIQFARCIMGLMGYDVSRLHLTRQVWWLNSLSSLKMTPTKVEQ